MTFDEWWKQYGDDLEAGVKYGRRLLDVPEVEARIAWNAALAAAASEIMRLRPDDGAILAQLAVMKLQSPR